MSTENFQSEHDMISLNDALFILNNATNDNPNENSKDFNDDVGEYIKPGVQLYDLMKQPNNNNIENTLDENQKSIHNSTSSSGYGPSLSSDSSTSLYPTSLETSLTNTNDSIPNTPKTPNYSNSSNILKHTKANNVFDLIQNFNAGDLIPQVNQNQNLNQQYFNSEILAKFGVNIDTIAINNQDALRKASLDNSLLQALTNQKTQFASHTPHFTTKTTAQEFYQFNYDPFNDYTGIDKTINQSNLNLNTPSLRKYINIENDTSYLSKSFLENNNLENFISNMSMSNRNSNLNNECTMTEKSFSENCESNNNRLNNLHPNNENTSTDLNHIIASGSKTTSYNYNKETSINKNSMACTPSNAIKLNSLLLNNQLDKLQNKQSLRTQSTNLNASLPTFKLQNFEHTFDDIYSKFNQEFTVSNNNNNNSTDYDDEVFIINSNNVNSFERVLPKQKNADGIKSALRNQVFPGSALNNNNVDFNEHIDTSNISGNLNFIANSTPIIDHKTRSEMPQTNNKFLANNYTFFTNKNENLINASLANIHTLNENLNSKKRALSAGINNTSINTPQTFSLNSNSLNSNAFPNRTLSNVNNNINSFNPHQMRSTSTCNSNNNSVNNNIINNINNNNNNSNNNNNNNSFTHHTNHSTYNNSFKNNNNNSIPFEHSFLTNVSPLQTANPNSQITNLAHSKPLRSERLPSQLIEDIIKQAKLRRKGGGKKEVCVFCRNNGEKEQIYTSHTLKDATNRVSCPILRLYQCPICHASADNAHTIKYCPFAEKDTGSIKLFKDSRINTAVLLMNSIANNTPPSPPSPPMQSQFGINKQQLQFNTMNPVTSINATYANNVLSNSTSLAQAFNNIMHNKNVCDAQKSSGILIAPTKP